MGDHTGENVYEKDSKLFASVKREIYKVFANISPNIIGGCADVICSFLEPYVCRNTPYIDEYRYYESIGRQLCKRLPGVAVRRIIDFAVPRNMLTDPIPCTITTSAVISNFNYDLKTLIDNTKVDGRYIGVIGNKYGWIIADGWDDPREKKSNNNKKGGSKGKGKCLFGTAQTTFRVKTDVRPNKIFCVKVFRSMDIRYAKLSDGSIISDKQYSKYDEEIDYRCEKDNLVVVGEWKDRNVIFETLGGIFVDCRDTKSVNFIVLKEVRRALGLPNLKLTKFYATMRNYGKIRVKNGFNVDLQTACALFNKDIDDNDYKPFEAIKVVFNPNKGPGLTIEVKILNHTSKKKVITVKIFQSGKMEIDSVVLYEHIRDIYKFVNKLIIKYSDDILYDPDITSSDDSESYYDIAGVEVPPAELRM